MHADDELGGSPRERLSRRALLRGVPLAAVTGGVVGYAVGAEPAMAGPTSRSAQPSPGEGRLEAGVVFRGPSAGSRIALTFDDGPSARWTPLALTLLARHGIPATFFVVGSRAARYPDLLEAVVSRGHQVGNHTWSHVDLVTQDAATVAHQLRRTHDLLATATTSAPTVFRPPWGKIDPVGLLAAAELGSQVVLWSHLIRGGHAGADTTATLQAVSPGGIVLAHDGGPTPTVALYQQLDRFVAAMHGRGYTFTTVDELLTTAPRAPWSAGPAPTR